MQSAYMAKNAAVTVRLPVELKRRLAARAQRERRSVSAQIVAELSRSLEAEDQPIGPAKSALGMFAGSRIPVDRDFQEVRALLWGKLGARRG
jgi:plasmid stability protein